jgi:hypothetical protein
MSQNTQDFSNSRRDQAPNGQFTLESLGARRVRPIGRSAGSVRAKALEEVLIKEMSRSLQQDTVSKFAIQTLDANSLGLPVPAVLIIQTVVTQGIDNLSVFSILLDGDDVRLPNRIDKVEGRSIETPTVVGDIYNSQEYLTRMTELVTMARPGRQLKIIDAGCIVLPKDFNLEQSDIHGLLHKSTLAAWNAMNQNVVLDDTPAYTLVGRNSNQEQLIGRINTTGENYLDEVGMPIRSDFVLEMDSSRHQAGREFLTSSSNIVKVAGYVEPVYTQPVQDPNAPNNQPFLAQIVLTRLATGYDAADTEMNILSLVTAAMIQVQNGWADMFRPRYNKKDGDVDYRDIGALGYCTEKAAKIDSRSDSFKNNFPAFMRDYFRLNQGVVFALDIPEVGPDVLNLDIFRAVASGNANAIAAFIRACDNLTGGIYSKKASIIGDFSMIIDTGNRIHNGYYPTDTGTAAIRDIRDIDLLAVANLYGKTNPAAMMQWADSFSPNTAPAAVRMANRLAIIDDALNGRQVITGYSGRYFIGPKWFEVITSACREAGLVVNPANMVHGLGSGLIMGGYDYSQFTAGQAGQSIYGGATAAGPGAAFNGRPGGRW